MDDDPNRKGNVAELAIAAEAARLGISVLIPLTEHERYDLVFDIKGDLLRVQCKWGALRDRLVCARLSTSRHTPRGYVTGTYAPGEVDAFGIYCEDLGKSYLVPIDVVAGQHTIQMRLAPPANGQRASLHWAADYDLPGAVAQLAERSAGSRKVGGSNPPSSTTPDGNIATVGAHEFRNLFGWYMERAAAGEEFVVTRRGKPCIRLGPVPR